MEAASEVRGELITGPTKTGKQRAISLPVFLADMLGHHIGRFPSSDGYVFPAAEGGPVRHHNFMVRHFKPATARTGLAGLRFHDLRHTCAALFIELGWNPKQIQDRLGHASIRPRSTATVTYSRATAKNYSTDWTRPSEANKIINEMTT